MVTNQAHQVQRSTPLSLLFINQARSILQPCKSTIEVIHRATPYQLPIVNGYLTPDNYIFVILLMLQALSPQLLVGQLINTQLPLTSASLFRLGRLLWRHFYLLWRRKSIGYVNSDSSGDSSIRTPLIILLFASKSFDF